MERKSGGERVLTSLLVLGPR